MPCDPSPYSIISSAITVLSGAIAGLIGALVANKYAVRRDADNRKHAEETAREDRKQDFLGLLSGMRAEAERLVGQQYANVFPERIYQLRRETPKIRRDLDPARQQEFDNTVKTLCQLTQNQVSDAGSGNPPAGRTRVTEAIDRIVNSLG
jgi:hypothetical protein